MLEEDKDSQKPVCKHCGCTDKRSCIQKYDEPCYWVIIDGKDSVCSACHDELMLKQQDKCGELD